MSNYKEIVPNLKLESHPDGGFFKRIYQSEKMIETSTGPRYVNNMKMEKNFSLHNNNIQNFFADIL